MIEKSSFVFSKISLQNVACFFHQKTTNPARGYSRSVPPDTPGGNFVEYFWQGIALETVEILDVFLYFWRRRRKVLGNQDGV